MINYEKTISEKKERRLQLQLELNKINDDLIKLAYVEHEPQNTTICNEIYWTQYNFWN